MKTFKDLEMFEKRVQNDTAWADIFRVGGRTYQLYEYGGGMSTGEPCYAYFINKRTHDAIEIRYRLPSTKYVNGCKVVEGRYEFIALDFIEDMSLWRPIV